MDSFNVIWQRAQAGDRAGARRELIARLQTDPRNVQAWALLAALLEDPAQKADCYRRILRIDPGNRRAAEMLQKLTQPSPAPAPGARRPATTAASLVCPNCGATMDVASDAGEHAQRVGCPYCGSEVDLTGLVAGAAEPGMSVGQSAAIRVEEALDDRPSYPQSSAADIPELFEADEIEAAEAVAAVDTQAPADDPLVDYVIKELGGHGDQNELIRQVCERGGMSWQQAEAFVLRVAAEHEHLIARRRSPLLLTLGVLTLIGGGVLTLLSGYSLFAYYSFWAGDPSATTGPVLSLQNAVYGVGVGLAMLLGGAAGVFTTLRSLRESAV